MNVKVFLHNDLDARGCALLLKNFMTDFLIKNSNMEFLSYNNINKSVNDYLDFCDENQEGIDCLIIADICVDKETSERLNSLYKDFKINTLLLFDHHPNNNQHLFDFEWCHLAESDISATKIIFKFLCKRVVKNNFTKLIKYKDFVECVNEWDTYKWIKTNNINAKNLNTLSQNTLLETFLNRYSLNQDIINLSPREKRIIEEKEESIKRIKKKSLFLQNGSTFYIFDTEYGLLNDINDYIFNKYPEAKIIIFVNLGNKSISYRSKDKESNVFNIAKVNGGGGHDCASGSLINEESLIKIVNVLLKDGFKDYDS